MIETWLDGPRLVSVDNLDLRNFSPVKLDASTRLARPGLKDGNGLLPWSPWIERARVSPVCRNSVRKD